MNHSTGVADLHLHTTASDGTCTVEDRIGQARDRDLQTIAITDHDCIAPELQGRIAVLGGIDVITGVEIRADVRQTKVEILGYYVDPAATRLDNVLKTAREYRAERNEEMVARLRAETGLDLDYEELRTSVQGALGRPHLADILVEANQVESVGEAFDQYLAPDGSAYVPMQRVPARDVLDAIHEADGVASLAHPGRIRTDTIEDILRELVAAGLDGIEVGYPYGTGGPETYADVDVEAAAELAEEYDLIETAGSDCHGPGSGKFRIGSVRVSASQLDNLRQEAGLDSGT